MTGWPTVRLGEILTERREIPMDDDLISGRVKIIEKISFATGKIQLRIEGATKTGMILVQPGDLVASGINAAKGAIAVYDSAATAPVAATIHYGSYEIDRQRADVRFLWWMLRSRFFQELLLEFVPGGIKTELKAKRLLPVPIPLPTLPEQRRIVARIEELADQVGEAQSLRQRASEEAEALLAAARRTLISESEGKIIALENACSEIIDNLHSNPRLSESGVPCVRSPDVGYGTLNLAGAQRTSEEEYRHRTRPRPNIRVTRRKVAAEG